MLKLLQKYVLLIIASLVAVRVLAFFTTVIWPDLFIKQIAEGITQHYSPFYLEYSMLLLFNIVLAILLTKDMKKEHVRSVPVVILTLLGNWTGIIFFFLILANKQVNSTEKSK